jgi:hypothetical protein
MTPKFFFSQRICTVFFKVFITFHTVSYLSKYDKYLNKNV